MPVVTDVLRAPGAFSVPFRRNPDLEDLLSYFRHIQFWWDNTLVAQGPLLTKDPQAGLLVASGALMPWWLGVDNEGQIVDLLRYCAANNKLGNADFALDDLYWKRAEDSGWALASGSATASTPFEDEDQLTHQDSFEVFAGDPMIFGATAHVASGEPGYLRLRAILSGRFVHPELVTNGGFESGGTGWTPDSDTAIVTDANARRGTQVARLGPVVKPNLIVDATNPATWETGDLPAGSNLDFDGDRFGGRTIREQFLLNRSFEDGFSNWTPSATGNVGTQTDGGAHGTTDYVRFSAGGTDTARVTQDLSSLQPGDEINITGFCRCPEGAVTAAGDDIPLIYGLRYTEEDEDFTPTQHIEQVKSIDWREVTGSTWHKQSQRTNIPDFDTGGGLEFRVYVPDIIGFAGYWDLDHFKIQRTRGNVEAIAQIDYWDVEPERAYEGSVVLETENVRRHGTLALQIVTTNGTDIETISAAELTVSEKTDTNAFQTLDFSFTPKEGHDQAKVKLLWQDVYVGAIWVHLDTLDVHEASGHRRRIVQTGKSVTPGRSYKLKGYIRPDESLTAGKAWLRAVLKQDSAIASYFFREDVIVEGPAIEFRDDALWAEVSLSVTPETGYDIADIELVCEDVEGGSFWVDDVSMLDTDKSTLVVEKKLLPTFTTPTVHTQSFTVPEGADSVGYQIALDGSAGEPTTGWAVDNAVLRRDCTPVAATTVVSEAIAGTGLSEGEIHDAGDIGFDLVLRHLTRRQILDEVSRAGVVQPPREWRVNPDGSVDWGTPEELYVDRTDVLLSEGDSWLIQDPDAQRSMEKFFTRHKVLGQERRSINGDPYTVTGEASNDPGDLELFDGSEFSRDQLIEDGGVDHAEFADAVAQDAADTGAEEQESYVLGLADWRTLGTFNVGDWIYVWHKAEGIEDLDNPMSVEGRTIYPKRLRVLERELTCGSGPFRCVLRRGPEDDPDGGIDLSEFVEWAGATTATVTVGNPRPEFLLNPLGGNAGGQFMKYRRAVPAA